MGLRNIGKLISIMARQNQMYIVREMNKIGITGSEYIFIANVPDTGFTTQQKICNDFELDPAFATRSINSLVKKGYLEKVQSKHDKRVFEIKLTKKGSPIKKQVKNKLNYWSDVLSDNMAESEIDELLITLNEIKQRANKEIKRRVGESGKKN